MNRKLLAAAVAGAVVPMVAQALDVSVSGRVNRIIRFADNGAGSDVQHLNGPSGSRFTFAAEGEVMEGLIFGANQDIGWRSNKGASVEVDDPGAAHDDFRRSYLYLGGDFGTVTMGHAAEAGNGAMWAPYNGAWAGVEYTADSNSAIAVVTTDEDPFGKTVGAFFPSVNNGVSNVLRYDSPSIGPVSFSISTQKDGKTDHSWSFGAGLSHDVGGTAVAANLVYREDVFGIAGGLQFAQGTSVNAGWGTADDKSQDFEDLYVQLGHSWGNMSVALQYRTTDNADDMEGRSIGLGANYSLGSGVDLFAGFNNYSFDALGPELEDVNSFHIGSQVSFN
jgi:hypothetical protein